jgi:hypothetical protein
VRNEREKGYERRRSVIADEIKWFKMKPFGFDIGEGRRKLLEEST